MNDRPLFVKIQNFRNMGSTSETISFFQGSITMQTNMLSIQQIFDGDIHYSAPLFQRPYVWTESNQWQPLWDDIRPIAEDVVADKEVRNHFLGASVHELIQVRPGTTRSFRIIDGQQRITTIQIFLKAIGDIAFSRSHPEHRQNITRFLTNNNTLNETSSKNQKFWPTHTDRINYKLVMDCESPFELKSKLGIPLNKSNVHLNKIAQAYLFFYNKINDWLESGHLPIETKLRGLLGAVLGKVTMVIIEIDEKDNPQAIFETLNDRGTRLLAADLIKNHLLSDVRVNKADSLYQQYWERFDTDEHFWRKEVGMGHAQRAQIDTFLLYALTLIKGKFVTASQLYSEFREMKPDYESGDSVKWLQRLSDLGDIYYRLNRSHSDKRISEFLYRMNVLNVKSAWPFVLALFEKHANDLDLVKNILVNLESFVIRRSICGWSTRHYNIFFSELAGIVKNTDSDLYGEFCKKFLNGSTEGDKFPSNAEFKDSWVNVELYRKLPKARLRMILEVMEEASRSDYSEEKSVRRRLSIEHILPQEWEEHWPCPSDMKDDRRKKIHTIGNLTLIEGKFNSAQSNRPWLSSKNGDPGKRDRMRKHSMLALNKSICDNERWGEDEIRKRAEELFQFALNVWPMPTL